LRYGIIADVHANLAALEAVLDDMGEVDELWCLGDLVGYGPDPNECVELLRTRRHLCIIGNHDLASIGRLDTSDFNPVAAAAADWTARALTERSRDFLLSLPERLVAGPFTLVHGSPRHPVWEYITHDGRAAPNFHHFDTPACLVGHTHVPALYVLDSERGTADGRAPGPDDFVQIGEQRVIVNPGGVGQPRDGDPRAAYAVYDSESRTLQWRRVPYSIEATQKRMREVGLPQRLIERLDFGW
jgi:diadenosine tetraphosphatase ApaH/serine/threonine PP2A family protein phosphatase